MTWAASNEKARGEGRRRPFRGAAWVFAALAWAAVAAGQDAPPAESPAANPRPAAPAPTPDPAAGTQDNAIAAASRRPDYDRSNAEMLAVVEPLVAPARHVTVSVLSQDRRVALGTIVDPNGFVLTKASELKGSLFCALSDGRTLSAEVYGIHEPTDLALLKIEATNLPIADWSESEPPPVGHWLITPRGSDSSELGVVSVVPRLIRAPAGFMGVQLMPSDKGVRIDRVVANSPAEQAGVRVNDIVIALNGEPKTDQVDLVTSVQQHSAGDEIELTVLRDGEERTFRILLGDQSIHGADRSAVQNELGGRLSRRRQGFPLALQHDTTLRPNDCGGPVIDLSGKIVGINIARSGRVDSLALPASVVRPLLASLLSGELSPAVIHKSRIEQIQARLTEIDASMATLPQAIEQIERSLETDAGRAEELQRVLADVQQRLAAVQEQQLQLQQQIDASRRQQDELVKEKERLDAELQKLTTGTN